MSLDGFVFIDLETTGTDHRCDTILEIGLALYSRDLEPVDHWHALTVTEQTPAALAQLTTDPNYAFVHKMHRKSGLLDDLSTQRPADMATYEAEAIDVLTRWGVDSTTPLCGSSLRMDRAFLEEWMPKLDSLMSYRIIDASSFMEFGRVRRAEDSKALVAKSREQAAPTHRVLEDIHSSANLLRVFDGLDPIPFKFT